MAKIERGRIDGVYGMESFTSTQLLHWVQRLEEQITDPKNTDDPKWQRRWIDKIYRLAIKKQKAHTHKERQRNKMANEISSKRDEICDSVTMF
jgi:hypothetical protein